MLQRASVRRAPPRPPATSQNTAQCPRGRAQNAIIAEINVWADHGQCGAGGLEFALAMRCNCRTATRCWQGPPAAPWLLMALIAAMSVESALASGQGPGRRLADHHTHIYEVGEAVPLFANKVGPYHNPR